ncbi:hypothetical protein RRG08_043692 [Elysia crispata]|uniref:NXPE C-terminal domain-containing protein n=1 Tax=Elysia crispata TaxID=231223 RepID=A0AAE0ZNK6_9GAST|nr:hypothetical protein RRG08_043692 [Elysia crispata]
MPKLKRLVLVSGAITVIALLLLNDRLNVATRFLSVFIKPSLSHGYSRKNSAQSGDQVAEKPITREPPILKVTDYNMDALLQEARQKPKCAEVIKDPKSFWKSQETGSKFTASQDVIRMGTAFRCGILDEEFLRRLPYDTLYPFERKYLSEPPAKSLDGVTSLQKTLVTLVTASKRSEVKVEEKVTVRVETWDASGRRKSLGGDEVWVWFVDSTGHNAITASVRDLYNGTYVASTAFRWPGTYRVKVAIAYPREYLRALILTHLMYKHTRLFLGHFANGKANETTPCYHTHILPGGYTELCDLTSTNGSPWYCGRPVKTELTCGDYKGGHNGDVKATEMLPLTPSEFKLIHTSYRTHTTHLVNISPTVTVIAPDEQEYPRACGGLTPCPLCNAVAGRHTWDLPQPTGYIYNNIWYPLNCRPHAYTTQQCFKNTEWILLGDSNLRSHYYAFSEQAGAADIQKALTKKWHKPLSCKNESLNFSMSWGPHTQPFLNGPLLAELGSLLSSTAVIDNLSSTGRYVIVMNHFYHISGSHLSSLHVKLVAIRDALVRLFRRNKHAIAILLSPHISWRGWSEHFGAGDMLGRHMMELEHQVFSEPTLRDRVIYIPAWDITQAIENVDFHPSRYKLITALIQNYACGRLEERVGQPDSEFNLYVQQVSSETNMMV